jgi:hypothetical protein
MSIIDSLKRVERAGDANSRATEKLFSAVHAVADLIADTIAPFSWRHTFTLPGGRETEYSVEHRNGSRYLCHALIPEDDLEQAYCGEFLCHDRVWNRSTALAFARDVADGLLDAIAEWLEKRAAENDAASETLEKATAKLSE